MSEKLYEGGNVLIFKRVPKHVIPVESATMELKELLIIYDQLIALLRQTYDDGLDSFTDSLVGLVVRCRAGLAMEMDEPAAQAVLKEMREELRQFPRNLRSLLPGVGPRLGESIERKLGVQFARY